ncbi:hypothetical protein HDU81_006660 [Chytriomyces hyalinus]|nr:hypothetical protein HDU81_006660 [Chytriomyces hyalinus]
MSCSSSSSSKSITTSNYTTLERMGARRSNTEGASRILCVCGECAVRAMRAASVASVTGRAGVTQPGGCGEPGCTPSDSSTVSNPFSPFDSVRLSPAESSNSSAATITTPSAPATSASTPAPMSSEAAEAGAAASAQDSEASQFAVLPRSATEPPHVFPCPSMKCQRGVHQTAPGMGLGRLATDVVVATLLATTLSLADSGSPFDPELFRADVECALCCNVFVQPVSCPCGHSFCRACVVSARSKCKPQCPVCRAAIPPTSYFLRRPQTAITALFAEWVSNCSSPQQQQQQQQRSQYTQPPATQSSSRSPSSASISSPTLAPAAPQLPPKVMLKPNQHIIPIFLGPKAVLPGVPCFMQFFEQRYKDMIAKIQEINKEGGRGWRSNSNGNNNNNISDSDSENNDCELGLMFGVCIIDDEAMARQNAAARMPATAPPASGSSNTATNGLKRNHAGEQQTRTTPSAPSNAAADYTRLMNGGCEPVGSTGAPLLKSVLNSSNSHLSPWVVDSIRPGSSSVYLEYGTALKLRSICPIYEEPAEGPIPPSATTNTNDGSRSAGMSGSNRSIHSDDDEGDVEMDENEQPESETETPTNEFQSQTQRQRRRRRRSSPVPVKAPAAVARYLVDGIGSWRFKVIERAICEGGLNIALVEYIEDLDFEDEAPCTLDLPETAGEEEAAAKSASMDEDAETKTLSDISAMTAAARPLIQVHLFRTSLYPRPQVEEKAYYPQLWTMTHPIPAPCLNSSNAPAFQVLPNAFIQASKSTHESSASIAHTVKQRLLSQTKQQERLHRLYARIAKIVTQILHIVTTSNLVRTNLNALTHFKLIHGAVPTTPTLLSFWLANLLNVTERAKYELLRDDVGGVVGRFEFILAIVQKGRRMVDAAVTAEAYAKATVAANAAAQASARSEENQNPDKMNVTEQKDVQQVQKENGGFDEMELQALKRVLRFMI